MNSNKSSSRKYFFLLAFIVVFISCQKTGTVNNVNNESNESRDFTWAVSVFNDASSMMDEAAGSNKLTLFDTMTEDSTVPTCSRIYKYNLINSDPDTIIIDFGTSNCLCVDRKYRRGQIIATYNPPLYTDSLKVIHLNFNNYHVNDYLVQGAKTIINLGRNLLGQYKYSTVVNGSITNTFNQTMTINSNEYKLWTVGDTALIWKNDMYQITGYSSGTAFNGITFTDTITSPLLITGSCHNIVSGNLTIYPTGGSAQMIDYGNGNCDAIMTVTIDGNIFTYVMH